MLKTRQEKQMQNLAGVKYQPRTYRNRILPKGLQAFRVVVQETDLLLHAAVDLTDRAREVVLAERGYLEAHIRQYPDFRKALTPLPLNGPAPPIVRAMAAAGQAAGVGPMAAVAGAIAEAVGKNLLQETGQVIVENGGDVFLRTRQPAIIGIWAGASTLSLRLGLRLSTRDKPGAVCTSSGTVGHSLSLGTADAVCVVSPSCALADAAATAIGNRVKTRADISDAIEFAKTISGIDGCVIIAADRVGMWGNIDLVPLR